MAAGAVKVQVTVLMVVVVMMAATSVVTVDAKLDFSQILGFFDNIETDSYEAVIKKVIILKSSDGDTFEVDEAVAVESQTIKHLIKDDCAENWIPLPNVTSKVLAKVIEYCKKHVEAAAVPEGGDEDLKRWDAEFVKVDHATLFDLILAANYLDIQSLLDLTTQTLGNIIMGKTPEEIRKLFNITSDYTPTENLWAFE